MYKFFCRNLKNYLNGIDPYERDYRSKISAVFAGFLDVNTYQIWFNSNPTKWAELSNLIYLMDVKAEKYPLFETLTQDLWGLGYKAIRDVKFDKMELDEQLKILYLCVKGQYL